MKKKLSVLIAVFLVAGASSVFAFGIGLQANGNASTVFEPGVALTFKFDSVPLVFAANWHIGDKVQGFGLTADYWLLNKAITDVGSAGTLNWFVGVGFFTNLTFIQDADVQFAGGLRIPMGLNMFLIDGVFEPFIQVAPSFGVRVIPSLTGEGLFIPMSIGARIWFK